MAEHRVLVCGGRNYANVRTLNATLRGLSPSPTVIIHGGYSGADELAGQWARANKITEIPFYAEWGKFGRAAGPIRNQRMLDEGMPDLVVAFPGRDGTANMIMRARAAGVPVIEIP